MLNEDLRNIHFTRRLSNVKALKKNSELYKSIILIS